MDNNLGKYIVRFRKEQGLTQQELADALYCTRQYISYLENDERKIPENLILPLSNILNFNFVQYIKEGANYKNINHYILAYKLVDLLTKNDYNKIQLFLKNETIINEFNYGYPYILKEYCSAIVEYVIEKNYIKSLRILLNVLKIKDVDEIQHFKPLYSEYDRYYSCIALLSVVLVRLEMSELAIVVLESSIDFFENEYFNNILPASSVNIYFKKIYIVLLNNYADMHFRQNKLTQAYDICLKLEQLIFQFELSYLLEHVLKLKMEIQYKLNLFEDAQETYNMIYSYCKIKKIDKFINDLNIEVENEYDLICTINNDDKANIFFSKLHLIK